MSLSKFRYGMATPTTNNNLYNLPPLSPQTEYAVYFIVTETHCNLKTKRTMAALMESVYMHELIARNPVPTPTTIPKLNLNKLSKKLKKALKKLLPGISYNTPKEFWEHIWQKHGVKTGWSEQKYFSWLKKLCKKFGVANALTTISCGPATPATGTTAPQPVATGTAATSTQQHVVHASPTPSATNLHGEETGLNISSTPNAVSGTPSGTTLLPVVTYLDVLKRNIKAPKPQQASASGTTLTTLHTGKTAGGGGAPLTTVVQHSTAATVPGATSTPGDAAANRSTIQPVRTPALQPASGSATNTAKTTLTTLHTCSAAAGGGTPLNPVVQHSTPVTLPGATSAGDAAAPRYTTKWVYTTFGQLVRDLKSALGLETILLPIKDHLTNEYILHKIVICLNYKVEAIPALNSYYNDINATTPIKYKVRVPA